MIRISAYLLSSAICSVIMFPQLIMFFFSFFFILARVTGLGRFQLLAAFVGSVAGR